VAAAVLERGPENSGERFTLFVLAFQADDLGFYAEEIKILQKDLSCSKETILRHLASLEKQGWLRIERRVLGGRSSVYFVNLEKLGVRVGEKPYKHKLWADMERMRSALDRGNKLSRQNGTLKFEQFAESGEVEASGDLFEEEISGDNLPPDNEQESAPEEGETDDSEEFEAQTAQNEGETVYRKEQEPPEEEISGGKLPPVRYGNSHLSGGNLPDPFNTSRKSRTFVETTTPLPPVPGDGGDELILPKDDLRVGDAEFPLAIGVAARWVMQKRGLSKRRLQDTIAEQLALFCRQEDKNLQEAAQIAAANHEKYTADVPLLRFGPWSPANFYGEGHWRNPSAWPYDQAKVRASSEAAIGMQKLAASETDAEYRVRVAEFIDGNADRLAEIGGFDGVVAKLRALPQEMDLGALDIELDDIESEMIKAAWGSSEPAVLATRQVVEAEISVEKGYPKDSINRLRLQVLSGRLFGKHEFPRLTLRCIPRRT
jgi:hypothetical protein